MNELEAAFARRRRSASSSSGCSGDDSANASHAAAPIEEAMELTVPPAEGTGSFGSPTDAFAHLLTAMTAADVQYAYKKLLELLGLKNPASISKLSDALAEQLPHRSKQLLATLTERARSVAAAAQQPKEQTPGCI